MSSLDAGAQAVSQEFVIKVNDMIAAANRIERRYDSHHAEVVLLHAFARYSAHHYRATAKADSEEQRQAFADYLADATRTLLARHILDMVGPVPAASTGDEPEPEPSAE